MLSKGKSISYSWNRYDILIQHFAHPNASANRTLRAVGVNIAVQKLIRRLDMYQSEQVKYLVKAKNEKLRSFGVWAPKQASLFRDVHDIEKIIINVAYDTCSATYMWQVSAKYRSRNDLKLLGIYGTTASVQIFNTTTAPYSLKKISCFTARKLASIG